MSPPNLVLTCIPAGFVGLGESLDAVSALLHYSPNVGVMAMLF